MSVSIEIAKPKHIEAIIDLVNAENRRSEALMKVNEDTVKGWVESRNSVVAVSNGKVVGHEALNIWPKCGWAELRSAVVLKEFRGQGIAYKMTKLLMDNFLKKNPNATFVGIKNKTERGNGILLDLGFKEVSLIDIPEELFTIRSYSERRAFVARFGSKAR